SLELNSFLVTVNGSEIWGPDGNLIERNPVSPDIIQWMWELSQTHQSPSWASSRGRVWKNEMPEKIADYEWLKFGFDINDDEVRETIFKELRANGNLEISNSSPTNIEINAFGVNKARGIERVCEIIGISMENVMAVGDSL